MRSICAFGIEQIYQIDKLGNFLYGKVPSTLSNAAGVTLSAASGANFGAGNFSLNFFQMLNKYPKSYYNKIRNRIFEANMDEKEFFYKLGRLIYRIDGAYEAYGRNGKIGSPNLLWILYALNDGGKHSQKQLCDEWAIPRSTANTIIKDLESKRYVTLSQIKGERRELLVSLTAEGRKYADGILSDLYQREKNIYDNIHDPDELLAALQDLAAKVQLIAKK